jgi:hypothetical protein
VAENVSEDATFEGTPNNAKKDHYHRTKGVNLREPEKHQDWCNEFEKKPHWLTERNTQFGFEQSALRRGSPEQSQP